jgi:hypothetical protein
LGENAGFGEPAGEDGLAGGSQNSLGVPPASTVHFAKPGDGEAEFQEVGGVNVHGTAERNPRQFHSGEIQQGPLEVVDAFEPVEKLA